MKTLRMLVSIAALSLSALAGSATAQSLAEKEAWQLQTDYSDRYVKSTKGVCKAQVDLVYDRPSWMKVQDKWGDGSPNGRCQDVFNALESICRGSADGQKAVASKIKSVRCSYGGKTSGHKLSLSGGTINYSVEIDRANVEEEIAKTLKQQL